MFGNVLVLSLVSNVILEYNKSIPQNRTSIWQAENKTIVLCKRLESIVLGPTLVQTYITSVPDQDEDHCSTAYSSSFLC
jgi:hypothetical protein